MDLYDTELYAGIIRRAETDHARLVRFLYCDAAGITRGKATHINRLQEKLREGFGLPVSVMATNNLDHIANVRDMPPNGEVRLVPDPRSYVPLPYIPNAASMLCDMYTLERTPWAACPRSFLRRMVQRGAEQGLVMQASFENEFYLFRPDGNPVDRHLRQSSLGMDSVAPYVDDLIKTLEQQNVAVEQYNVEEGPGQQKLTLRHAVALSAADHHLVIRETIRGVAMQHNLIASFAPKPLQDAAGSGAQVHMSIWDMARTTNLFYDERQPDHLSELARHWIGGILAHLPALVALLCPTVNSYRRLQNMPQYGAYGLNNRNTPLRIASPYWEREMSTINIALSLVDHTANPYIALGAILAAGLDGIQTQIDPGMAIQVSPEILSDEERAERGMLHRPTTLGDALDALAADTVLMSALGSELAQAFIAVKRSEIEAYSGKDWDYEVKGHYYKY